MLVKFEEEDKNTDFLAKDINIELLSTEAGKKEAEFVEEKLNPTDEELRRLEEELQKINEKKFGNLVEQYEPVEEIPEKITPEKKVLTYTRRDA
jgi:hypothetical protein